MPVEFGRGINEVKSLITSTATERLIRPVKLEIVDGATMAQAKELDSHSGNFLESANCYYSVLEASNSPEERLDALIGLSQQLINLGRFGQAKQFISDNSFEILRLQRPEKKVYYLACVNEKLGWVADNEGKYKEASIRFKGIRDSIGSIPKEFRKKEENEIYSTAVHFLGRANFGLGKYDEAIKYFDEHLSLPGLANDELAYSHGWLTRCYNKKGDFEKAHVELDSTRTFFEKYMETHPQRGVMAKYYLIEGEYFFSQNELNAAAGSLNKSLNISFSGPDGTAKSKAEAMFGLAAVSWAQNDFGKTISWVVNGIKTYPLSLIKPSI